MFQIDRGTLLRAAMHIVSLSMTEAWGRIPSETVQTAWITFVECQR